MLDREVEIINALFEAGMERFHLRKPDWDLNAYQSFLHHIPSKHHPKISIHGHHELRNTFHLGGLHFTEKHRESLGLVAIQSLQVTGLKLSTSFHNTEQIKAWDGVFDYAFLSPVFDSISKQGYKGAFQEDFIVGSDFKSEIIGLGGIRAEHIEKVREMNFAGAAVLGTIWKKPQLAVENFKQLKQLVTCVPTYSA